MQYRETYMKSELEIAQANTKSIQAQKVALVQTRTKLDTLLGVGKKDAITAAEVTAFEQPLRQIFMNQEAIYTTLPASARQSIDATVRKSTWVKRATVEEVKKDMPDLAKMTGLGSKIGDFLAAKANNALKIEQDKRAFQEQEKARLNQLRADIVDSLKKIQEYEADIKSYDSRKDKMLAVLGETKAYYAKLGTTMEGLLRDEDFAKTLL